MYLYWRSDEMLLLVQEDDIVGSGVQGCLHGKISLSSFSKF